MGAKERAGAFWRTEAGRIFCGDVVLAPPHQPFRKQRPEKKGWVWSSLRVTSGVWNLPQAPGLAFASLF